MSEKSQIAPAPSAATKDKPDEAVIPTRMVLDNDAFDCVAQLIENPPPPTEALRKLLRGP
jgi:hypothetical protein